MAHSLSPRERNAHVLVFSLCPPSSLTTSQSVLIGRRAKGESRLHARPSNYTRRERSRFTPDFAAAATLPFSLPPSLRVKTRPVTFAATGKSESTKTGHVRHQHHTTRPSYRPSSKAVLIPCVSSATARIARAYVRTRGPS